MWVFFQITQNSDLSKVHLKRQGKPLKMINLNFWNIWNSWNFPLCKCIRCYQEDAMVEKTSSFPPFQFQSLWKYEICHTMKSVLWKPTPWNGIPFFIDLRACNHPLRLGGWSLTIVPFSFIYDIQYRAAWKMQFRQLESAKISSRNSLETTFHTSKLRVQPFFSRITFAQEVLGGIWCTIIWSCALLEKESNFLGD